MQLHKLFGGLLLVVFFHKLIDINDINLQSSDLGQRRNLVVTLHMASDSSMSHSTILSRQNFFKAEVEIRLVIPFHAFSLPVMFLIFSESKVCP
ncbi:hypothetical protein AVEN_82502-1 [Araneus ventricosus]|uniref:Secreted protein n=1 Tax=Araneus ventricosus TaxID=182803 RepID=A0A4Y2RAN8_ARAVE|nr:hypothetical protein AVEN_139481-1 [Araneus ventricosus]GBN72827.1 hypothetical protein AVEN_82502-1 [Araneus ventricosus]